MNPLPYKIEALNDALFHPREEDLKRYRSGNLFPGAPPRSLPASYGFPRFLLGQRIDKMKYADESFFFQYR